MGGIHIEETGTGPRVLFVHGSVFGGGITWRAQAELATRWTLGVVDRRGFGTSPAAEGEDFEVDAHDIAVALGSGAHLVAHSYGGVGALLAAANRPEAVHSLTLVEPAAYSIAMHLEHVRQATEEVDRYISASRAAPREFLTEFFRLAGVEITLPDPLPQPLAAGAQLLMSCRYPWLARFPLKRLRDAPFRTLVISGGHSAVFESICDLLTTELNAERDVLSGAGHAVPRLGHPFNQRLEQFLNAQTLA